MKKLPVPVLMPGAEVAPGLQVLAHMRRGGHLDIYDVWSEERDCRCIVKMLRPDKAKSSAREALLFEGRLLLSLTHPHLVRAYSLLEQRLPILVLETLSGSTLGRLLQRRPLKPNEAAILGQQLCSAVGYLHRHKVLHLDLKPDNIVAQGGLAKVLDLSIARGPGRGYRGEGTPAYMAPEQRRGAMLSTATDVWGLGAVLFEALSGRLARPLKGPRLPLPRRIPVRLREVVESCLAARPQSRPTVAELSSALSAVTG